MTRRKKKSRGLGYIEIRRMNLADLTPADYNPRIISEDNLKRLDGSVNEFGCVQPIIWNKRSGRVVGGHQRLDVLLMAGEVEADISIVDLDDGRERALNVALNNEHAQGKWDYQALSDLLRGLDEDIRVLTFMPEYEVEPLLEAVWQPTATNDSIFDKPKAKKKKVVCPECKHEFEVE